MQRTADIQGSTPRPQFSEKSEDVGHIDIAEMQTGNQKQPKLTNSGGRNRERTPPTYSELSPPVGRTLANILCRPLLLP